MAVNAPLGPDPGDDPEAIQRAEELVEETERLVEEEVPERALADNQAFFDDVVSKSKDVLATVHRTGRVTARQMRALENWQEGVRRWARPGRG